MEVGFLKRYSSRNRLSVGDGGERLRRVQTVAIALLAIALAASLITLLPGASYRSDMRRYAQGRMLSECDDAVQQAARLSRTASTSSYDALARIRSEVYAIDTLNEALHDVGNEAYLIDPAVFTAMYNLLDTYNNKLITGIQTGEQQSQLTADLDSLHKLIEALQ